MSSGRSGERFQAAADHLGGDAEGPGRGGRGHHVLHPEVGTVLVGQR